MKTIVTSISENILELPFPCNEEKKINEEEKAR